MERNEQTVRDIAVTIALVGFLAEINADTDDLLTDGEAAALMTLSETLPQDHVRYVEIVKRMFREAVDRLLAAAQTEQADVAAE